MEPGLSQSSRQAARATSPKSASRKERSAPVDGSDDACIDTVVLDYPAHECLHLVQTGVFSPSGGIRYPASAGVARKSDIRVLQKTRLPAPIIAILAMGIQWVDGL